MEQIDIKLLLRSKKSSEQIKHIPKKLYTTPQIQEYQNTVGKYQKYMNNLNCKINKICQKQQFRTYLKEQKLNSIKSQLLSRKNQLQKQLQEKLDPTKSSNGKLHIEINQLKKLQTSYKQILSKLQKNVKDKQKQIDLFNQLANNQKLSIRQQIKAKMSIQSINQSCIFPNISKDASDTSTMIRQSSVSYKSKSRDSVLLKLGNSWQQKTADIINEEEQKLIMLRLLCVYARSNTTDNQCPISPEIIQLVQKQIKLKNEWLFQIKQMLNKNDGKRSLHND